MQNKSIAAAEGAAENSQEIKAKIDAAVLPILIKALQECANKRPQKPLEFVASYLMENNHLSNSDSHQAETSQKHRNFKKVWQAG